MKNKEQKAGLALTIAGAAIGCIGAIASAFGNSKATDEQIETSVNNYVSKKAEKFESQYDERFNRDNVPKRDD